MTDCCNLHCNSCPRLQGTTFMDVPHFKAILEKLGFVKHVMFNWLGEPTLHRDLPEMVKLAKLQGASGYVSTNGATEQLGHPAYARALLRYLDRFCFCVDGYDQESLSRYRAGASWGQLKKNLRVVSCCRGVGKLQMRVLMFRWNDGMEEFYKQLARDCGFDSLVFAAPTILLKSVLSDEEAAYWMSSNPKYQRYIRIDGGWMHKSSKSCRLRVPIISANGDVVACAWDAAHRYVVGNIFEDSVSSIEGKFGSLRELMADRKLDLCGGCLCMTGGSQDYNVEFKDVRG